MANLIGQIDFIQKLVAILKQDYPKSPLLFFTKKKIYRDYNEKKFWEKISLILRDKNEEGEERGICNSLSLLLAHTIIYSGKSDWFWQQISKIMEDAVDLENDKDMRLFFDNVIALQRPDVFFSAQNQLDSISLAGLQEVSSIYTTISQLSELERMFLATDQDGDSSLWIPGKTYLFLTSTHVMHFQYREDGKYEFLDPNLLSLSDDETFIAQEWSAEELTELLSKYYLENSSGPIAIYALDKKDAVDEHFFSIQRKKFDTYFNAWLKSAAITDINRTGITGLNLLCMAIIFNKPSVVKELIAHGASYTQVNHAGFNAQHLAVIYDRVSVMKIIIDDFLAYTKKIDERGFSFLDLAAENGCLNAVKALIACGASVNSEGITPLLRAVENGHPDIVKELISHGALVNQSYEGLSPLYVAVQNGNLDIVKELLAHGAAVNQATHDYTPLHAAAATGQIEVAKELLAYNPGIDQPDKSGRSPLYCAVYGQHVEVVKLLLAQGADIYKCNNKGRSPFSLTKKLKSKEINKLLREQDEKLTMQANSKDNELSAFEKEDILPAVKKAIAEYQASPVIQERRYSQFAIKDSSVKTKKAVSNLLEIVNKIEKNEERISTLYENLVLYFEELSYEDDSLNFFLLQKLANNELHNRSAAERKILADDFVKTSGLIDIFAKKKSI